MADHVKKHLIPQVTAAYFYSDTFDCTIVVPSLPGDERFVDDYQCHAETLNRAGEKTREAGITMTYHNHAFEFKTACKMRSIPPMRWLTASVMIFAPPT